MLEMILLPAISVGLSAAAIPGPLQAYILNITLRYGWRRGILIIFAPLIVDGPIILASVFLLEQIPDVALQGIRIIGGILLLWIAWGAWQQLRAGASFTDDSSDDPEKPKGMISIQRVMGTALAMNIFSPGPYLFWATINGPLLIQANDEFGAVGVLAMLLGFYIPFIGGLFLLVMLFDRLGQVDERVTQRILLVTIGLLVWFGTSLIAEAFGISAVHQTLTPVVLGLVILYALFRRFTANSTKGKNDAH